MRVETIGNTTLYLGDCRDVLPTLSGVDAVVTDPPYFKVKGEDWDNQWSNADKFLAWLGDVLDECAEVMNDWASLYCFASPQMEWSIQGLIRERFVFLNSIRWKKPQGWHMKQSLDEIRIYQQAWEACIFAQKADDGAALEASGYEKACDKLHKKVFTPLGGYFKDERLKAGLSYRQIAAYIDRDSALYLRWEEGSSLPNKQDYAKCQALFAKGGEHFLRKEYEDLRKEYEDLRKEYEDLRRPFSLYDRRMSEDIWEYNTVSGYDGKHPCEKPVSVMKHIVGTSTKVGHLVVDPFMGSGSTGVACETLGRAFVGVEKYEPYFDIACRRIEAAQRQSDLFGSQPTAPPPHTSDLFAVASDD